jgi:membrane dipeptidase
MPPLVPIFDGHNDTLIRVSPEEGAAERCFFLESAEGHVDLPRARAGGLAGGMCAIYVPRPPEPGGAASDMPRAIDPVYAQRFVMRMLARLCRIEDAARGSFTIVRTVDELDARLARGGFAAVLHFEGAEAIDPELDALRVFHRLGLRSLGIVWSRPNVFGHGVPFAFPGTPDTGPGLTAPGKALVRACNELGIAIDCAHLNERGFFEVAALSRAPLIASHAAAHALCPSSRNLTDAQLDAIAASGGVVGVTFCTAFLRADGQSTPDTPLREVVRHVEYIAERIGIDHVGLGSDFDGAVIPRELGSAARLPALIDALRIRGFGPDDLAKLARLNWRRVLAAAWH